MNNVLNLLVICVIKLYVRELDYIFIKYFSKYDLFKIKWDMDVLNCIYIYNLIYLILRKRKSFNIDILGVLVLLFLIFEK